MVVLVEKFVLNINNEKSIDCFDTNNKKKLDFIDLTTQPFICKYYMYIFTYMYVFRQLQQWNYMKRNLLFGQMIHMSAHVCYNMCALYKWYQ